MKTHVIDTKADREVRELAQKLFSYVKAKINGDVQTVILPGQDIVVIFEEHDPASYSRPEEVIPF